MLEGKNLHKSFREGDREITVLRGFDLSLEPKQKIGIVGASGVGKSTLLHLLGGLEEPTEGQVWVEGKDLFAMKEGERAHLRNRYFGFVFQFYHLIPELTVLENTVLPAWIAGLDSREAKAMARAALEQVGLADRHSEAPLRLSGGEQQRVAIARALVLKPKVVLADEPTGNLDQDTGSEAMRYLWSVLAETGGSLLLVTHNRELTKNCDAVWELKNGTLHQI